MGGFFAMCAELLLRQIEIQFGGCWRLFKLRLLRRHRLVQGAALLQQNETTGPQQEQQHATSPSAQGSQTGLSRSSNRSGVAADAGMAAEGAGGRGGGAMVNDLAGNCSCTSRPSRVVPKRVASTLYCPAALRAERSTPKRGAVATSLNVMLLPLPSMALPWMTTEAGSSSSTSMTRESLAPPPRRGDSYQSD